jgi:hypothetical protein
MRRLFPTASAALALLAACAPPAGDPPAAPATETKEATTENCSLTIRFGSYAMGIDGQAAAAVDRVLAGHRGVARVERSGFGREGEYALCVHARGPADAARLFEELKAVLPARPRGPIEIVSGTRRFAVPRE